MTIKEAIKYYDDLIKRAKNIQFVDMSRFIKQLKDKRDSYTSKIGK